MLRPKRSTPRDHVRAIWLYVRSVLINDNDSRSPRVRVDLLELDLMLDYRVAIGIEDQESRGGCAVVYGANEGLLSVSLLESQSTILRLASHCTIVVLLASLELDSEGGIVRPIRAVVLSQI